MYKAVKYPGLSEALAAAGNVTSYPAAFMRLDHGWSMKRATETPTRFRGKRKSWAEKKEANKVARDARIAARLQRAAAQPPRRQSGRHWNNEDASPVYIQVLRAAYCGQFITTGVLDESMATMLRTYAHAKRTTEEHSLRVPAEHAAQDHRRETATDGDDRRGITLPVTGAAAGGIADFLRL